MSNKTNRKNYSKRTYYLAKITLITIVLIFIYENCYKPNAIFTTFSDYKVNNLEKVNNKFENTEPVYIKLGFLVHNEGDKYNYFLKPKLFIEYNNECREIRVSTRHTGEQGYTIHSKYVPDKNELLPGDSVKYKSSGEIDPIIINQIFEEDIAELIIYFSIINHNGTIIKSNYKLGTFSKDYQNLFKWHKPNLNKKLSLLNKTYSRRIGKCES